MALPDPWDDVFRCCDFEFVKNDLISTFAGGVYPKEMVNLLSVFADRACRETAIPLIEYSPEFALLFRDSANAKRFLEESGVDTTRPRLTVRMLAREPEFEEYCTSVTEDSFKHKTLGQQLLDKGLCGVTVREGGGWLLARSRL